MRNKSCFLVYIILFCIFANNFLLAHNINPIKINSDNDSSFNSFTNSNPNFRTISKSNTNADSIHTNQSASKRIALTFDDGPNPSTTPRLLAELKKRDVRATFFVIGKNAEQYPDILKQMSDDGHVIGNHSYSHCNLSKLSEEQAVEEITKTTMIITHITQKDVCYIRPPYGFVPEKIKNETHLTPILWNVDPRDWSVLNANSVAKHILSRAKDGDIILLHDIFDTSVDAALIVIDELKKEGFEFVTIDELYHGNESKPSK